ncbi:hypothetical protein [Cytobacillus sp.]
MANLKMIWSGHTKGKGTLEVGNMLKKADVQIDVEGKVSLLT